MSNLVHSSSSRGKTAWLGAAALAALIAGGAVESGLSRPPFRLTRKRLQPPRRSRCPLLPTWSRR